MSEAILIISSDKFTRTVCSEAFSRQDGYRLDFVSNGPNALFALSEDLHRAALVDYDMAEMNGLEFLKVVRCGRSGARRDLSIGMFAGEANQTMLTAAVALDLNTLMATPISQKMVAQRTDRILTKKLKLKSETDYESIQPPLSPQQIKALAVQNLEPVKTLLPQMPPQMSRQPSTLPNGGGPSIAADPNAKRYGPRLQRKIEDLRVGWQITDDLLGPSGVRLIGAGTVLTPNLLLRLQDRMAQGNVTTVWARAPLPPA